MTRASLGANASTSGVRVPATRPIYLPCKHAPSPPSAHPHTHPDHRRRPLSSPPLRQHTRRVTCRRVTLASPAARASHSSSSDTRSPHTTSSARPHPHTRTRLPHSQATRPPTMFFFFTCGTHSTLHALLEPPPPPPPSSPDVTP
jgi:hypothetical protein